MIFFEDYKKRGFLLSALIVLRLTGILVFTPIGIFLHFSNNPIFLEYQSEFGIKVGLTDIIFELIVHAVSLALIIGIVLWKRIAAYGYIAFSLLLIFVSYVLDPETFIKNFDIMTFAWIGLWMFVFYRKWEYFN